MRSLFKSRSKSISTDSEGAAQQVQATLPLPAVTVAAEPANVLPLSQPIPLRRPIEAPPPSFEAISAEPPNYLTASSPPSISHLSQSAPTQCLPSYTPNLQTNELRLISTIGEADLGRSRQANEEIVVPQSTKRLKVVLTSGGFRMISFGALRAQLAAQAARRNSMPPTSVRDATSVREATSGRVASRESSVLEEPGQPEVTARPPSPPQPVERTGPVIIRVGRGGEIAGHITLNLKAKGEKERIELLEIGLYGTTINSMFIRGQYSLLDTVPILKETRQLWPPTEDNSTAELEDGQVFNFSIPFPTSYPSHHGLELPPSVSVAQYALQSEVTYFFKIKMKRKGWRMNDEIAVPVLYEPRGWINPRRVNALTVEDLMNPGWRTIKLRGGKERHNMTGPSVEATILMPTPPIMIIDPHRHEAQPSITVHIHLHSTLPLPLATFASTALSDWKIRFVRAVTINVHGVSEVRHSALPTIVELRNSQGQVVPLDGGPSITSPKPRARRRSSLAETFSLALHRESSRLNDTDTAPLLETAVEEEENDASDAMSPISLTATDVDFTATLTLDFKTPAARANGPFVQSFISPELSVGYMVMISITPRSGAVKERFMGIDGSGQVEIVLPRREGILAIPRERVETEQSMGLGIV